MRDSSKFEQIKTYYEDRYTDESRRHRPLEHYNIYLNHLGIRDQSNARILDVACGTGHLLKNAEMRGMVPFGVDISKTALEIARTGKSGILYAINSAEDICFRDNQFDYVSCLGSIEHFLNIPKAVSEMIRVAKPDGRFCFMVPNTIHYRLDAKSKWGVKKIVGTKQQEMQEELHTYEEWKSIFERNGLRVNRVHKDLFYVKKTNILKNALFHIWLRFLPLKYSYQFIFICSIAR